MLTKLVVRNFKRFEDVEIELGDPVVFIGPNNSGKTTALQALALWEIGLKRWLEKRKGKTSPEKRPGVTINRRDLTSVPVPNAKLLWRDLHVSEGRRIGGKPSTRNVCIEILVNGLTFEENWQCGLEFYYANEESFYCRPLRINDDASSRMPIPNAAERFQMAFLPPMSGLAANEHRQAAGTVNVLIGEGRTAEVLRNLCHNVFSTHEDHWKRVLNSIDDLFGCRLKDPEYIPERGEIVMQYREPNSLLDLSCAGRGLQQTLLLLSYMYANAGSVLLLDEPDAHLEILRQRQIYQKLTEVAHETGSQLIIASHSEVLLNEAAERDVVTAFVGYPHRIAGRGSQVLKSLRDIGFEHYYQAQDAGWVLYLEGSTDLAILKALADKLNHQEAQKVLSRPYVHYVGNQAKKAFDHFRGIAEAVPQLKAICILDRLDREALTQTGPKFLTWRKREIENYLCHPAVLEAFAAHIPPDESPGPLFDPDIVASRIAAMQRSMEKVAEAWQTARDEVPWSDDMLASEFLSAVFKDFYKSLGLYNIMAKKNFHELARFVLPETIDDEVREKLDAIVAVALEVTASRTE